LDILFKFGAGLPVFPALNADGFFSLVQGLPQQVPPTTFFRAAPRTLHC